MPLARNPTTGMRASTIIRVRTEKNASNRASRLNGSERSVGCMQLVRVRAEGESAAQRYQCDESRKWLIFLTICFRRAQEILKTPVFLRCFAFVHCTRSVGGTAVLKVP